MAKRRARKAARKSSVRRVRINAKAVAQAIEREVKTARNLVAAGQRAVAAARKEGRRAAAAANQKTLARAKRVLSALEKASAIARSKPRGVKYLRSECPFQIFGPDPFSFE